MNKIRIFLISFIATLSIFIYLVPAGKAGAVDIITPGCQNTPDAAVCKDKNPGTTSDNAILGPNGLLTKGIQIFAIIVGIISVIVIMIAGLQMITSGGDADAAAKARKGILYGVIGLLIVLLAQAIVSFVLSKL